MSINSFTGMAVPPRDRGRRYRMEAGIGWPREGRHHKDKERFLGAFGTSKWRVGKRIGRGKISGDYRLMGRRGGTRARCARSGWRWSGRYRKMPTSRQWSARGSGRAGPSTALRAGPSATLRAGGGDNAPATFRHVGLGLWGRGRARHGGQVRRICGASRVPPAASPATHLRERRGARGRFHRREAGSLPVLDEFRQFAAWAAPVEQRAWSWA